LCSPLVFDRYERCQSAKDNEEHDQDHGEDDQFLHGGVLSTILAPLPAALAKVFLELVATDFVIYETRKRDSVSEELKGAHRVAENDHGGHNEENIFKDTGKSKNEGRGFADLGGSISFVMDRLKLVHFGTYQEHDRHVQ